MASTNTKIAAAVIVIIIIIAAVAVVWWVVSDDDDDGTDEYTFLIEDQDGVYFWISGEGDNSMDALIDATESFGIDLEYSTSSYGTSPDSLFGMGMVSDGEGNWTYWNQFVWDGSAWIYSEYTMDEVDLDYCNGYVALVYGGWVQPEDIAVTPTDAVVWDKSTDGTVFTIRAESGLWFKVNGTGETVYDAFAAAADKYKIPFEPTYSGDEPNGIDGMFGLYMDVNEAGNWVYWQQNQVDENGEEYEAGGYMNHLYSSENPEFVIFYGEYVWLG